MSGYTVSKDLRSGMWYAHQRGYAYIPICGSFSDKKSESLEYAKMYNCLPNNVEQIEERRKAAFKKESENGIEVAERYCTYMIGGK